MNIQVPQRDKQSETASPEEKEEGEGDAMGDTGKIQKYYFTPLLFYIVICQNLYILFSNQIMKGSRRKYTKLRNYTTLYVEYQ